VISVRGVDLDKTSSEPKPCSRRLAGRAFTADVALLGIMWVTFGHLRPLGHIMPNHAGDRGAVFLVLVPHDHLHIKHEREPDRFGGLGRARFSVPRSATASHPVNPGTGQPGRRRTITSPPGMIISMIGRMHHVVLDCPDPAALAAFYAALLRLPVTYRDDDWVVVAASDTSAGLAFQRAPGNQPPTWPNPAVPQQFHLDIMVEDPASAGPRVLALGAVKLNGQNVYADPAGHPFCLIRRPRWAAQIPDDT
jgi:catechol 2,3-dioxygenase-like lactoylglutathione lyase family enzyme